MSGESYHYAEIRSAAEAAPLFFLFHGTGGDETQFLGLGRQLMPQAHLVAPRGDVSEHGALRFFRRTAEGVYDMDDLARRTETMAAFVAAQRERLGASRVIGLGYSNGANILASVMLAEPGLFDDAVMMHPLIPWQIAPQPGLAGRRVLITAGRRDPICPPALTESLAAALARDGADTELIWHEGGHEVREPELQAAARFLAAVPA